MSASCLQCGQTRAEVKQNETICGIEGGYEYVELEVEWPRHRWADWTDKDLARFGVLPAAFEKYRRTAALDMEYVPCAERARGHTFPTESDREWGLRTDSCMACGQRAALATQSAFYATHPMTDDTRTEL